VGGEGRTLENDTRPSFRVPDRNEGGDGGAVNEEAVLVVSNEVVAAVNVEAKAPDVEDEGRSLEKA